MKRISTAIFVSTLALLTACSPSIPFTNYDIEKYNLDEASLQKIQFFISNDITLQRGENTNEAQEFDANGKLIVSKSATIDEILIKEGTPGVMIKRLSENRLAISFDVTDDNKYLVFGDPNNRGRYYLMASEWKQGKGKINYGDKIFYIISGGEGAYLKYKMQNNTENKKSISVEKGRKVN